MHGDDRREACLRHPLKARLYRAHVAPMAAELRDYSASGEGLVRRVLAITAFGTETGGARSSGDTNPLFWKIGRP